MSLGDAARIICGPVRGTKPYRGADRIAEPGCNPPEVGGLARAGIIVLAIRVMETREDV